MHTKIINKAISSSVLCFALISSTMLNATSSLPAPNDKTVAELRPKLNSERIEYFFGSYGVETINACADIFPDSRISNLYSTHDKKKIMRTFAVVDYVKPIPEPLLAVHEKIKSGESVGTALKMAGWEIVKTPIYFGEINLSVPVMKWMHEVKTAKGAAYVYQLSVHNKEHPNYIPYSTIAEVYSPQYLTLEWMKAFYGEAYFEHDDNDLYTKTIIQNVTNCLNKLPDPN